MNKAIANVFKIKNSIEYNEFAVEDCSEHYPALEGYSVVLDYNRISDVRSFLLMDYGTFTTEIDKAFDQFNNEGDTTKLKQLLEVYKDGGSYTEVILEANGGIESILGTPVDLGKSKEEEEEEMYKEMYEQLKTKYDEEIKNKDSEIESLKEKLSKVEVIKSLYDGLDVLEYENIDQVVDILQDMPESSIADMVFDLIQDNAKEIIDDPSYDVNKLPALTLYMNQIVDWLDDNGYL